MKGGLLILLAVLLIVGFMGCNGYNGLVKQDEKALKKHGTMFRQNTRTVQTW